MEMSETDMLNQQSALRMGLANYSNTNNDGINTLLNDLTNVTGDIDEVELLLQGKRVGLKGQEEVVCEALCNKEGAVNMARLMRSMVGRIMLMSNLEEDQIRLLTEELGYDIVEDLTLNKVRYGIIHPKAMSSIVDLVLTKCFSCGMSAMENGTRRMLRGTTMETTINTQGNSIKGGKGGGGIMGLLGVGKK